MTAFLKLWEIAVHVSNNSLRCYFMLICKMPSYRSTCSYFVRNFKFQKSIFVSINSQGTPYSFSIASFVRFRNSALPAVICCISCLIGLYRFAVFCPASALCFPASFICCHLLCGHIYSSSCLLPVIITREPMPASIRRSTRM